MASFITIRRMKELRAHSSKVQSQHEYEVGAEYNEEIPRRILRDVVQNRRNL